MASKQVLALILVLSVMLISCQAFELRDLFKQKRVDLGCVDSCTDDRESCTDSDSACDMEQDECITNCRKRNLRRMRMARKH